MKHLIGILAALMLSFSPALAQWHGGGVPHVNAGAWHPGGGFGGGMHVGPGFHGGWQHPVGPAWHGGWHGGGGGRWWGGRWYGEGVGPCWRQVPPLIGPWVWVC